MVSDGRRTTFRELHDRVANIAAALRRQEVEAGRHGELVTRGANVMRSYWNNPDGNSTAFRDGFFRTGDVGYQDADGYCFILDRLKDMIVTDGENLYRSQVEAV